MVEINKILLVLCLSLLIICIFKTIKSKNIIYVASKTMIIGALSLFMVFMCLSNDVHADNYYHKPTGTVINRSIIDLNK